MRDDLQSAKQALQNIPEIHIEQAVVLAFDKVYRAPSPMDRVGPGMEKPNIARDGYLYTEESLRGNIRDPYNYLDRDFFSKLVERYPPSDKNNRRVRAADILGALIMHRLKMVPFETNIRLFEEMYNQFLDFITRFGGYLNQSQLKEVSDEMIASMETFVKFPRDASLDRFLFLHDEYQELYAGFKSVLQNSYQNEFHALLDTPLRSFGLSPWETHSPFLKPSQNPDKPWAMRSFLHMYLGFEELDEGQASLKTDRASEEPEQLPSARPSPSTSEHHDSPLYYPHNSFRSPNELVRHLRNHLSEVSLGRGSFNEDNQHWWEYVFAKQTKRCSEEIESLDDTLKRMPWLWPSLTHTNPTGGGPAFHLNTQAPGRGGHFN